MNIPLEFTVNSDNNTVTVKKQFKASISDVWAAWTEPELLDQWWAPKPWQSKTKTMEFKKGGQRLYAMCGPNGEEHWAFAEYDTIAPKTHFTYLDGFCDAAGNLNVEFPRSFWSIEFVNDVETTMVNIVIKHKKLSDLEMIIKMGFKEGFTIALEGLDEYFQTKIN